MTRDDDLLVFIDETGHEDLSTGGGIFGLGGVAVYGADYFKNVVEPWVAVRALAGVSRGSPLHAAGDRPVYRGHAETIATFFSRSVFVRHASMVTLDTIANIEPFIAAAFGGLFRNVGRILQRVSSASPVARVVYIVEHSCRLWPEYRKLAGPRGPTLVAADGRPLAFEHAWAALKKSACEPGLEVSDFVMHAAYGQVRAGRAKPGTVRRDFECVFRAIDPGLVEYMELTALTATPTDGLPGLWRVPLQ